MFPVRSKVVCVDDKFPPEAARLYKEFPRKNVTYTVRAVYIGRGNYLQDGHGKQEGEIGVLLEEIRNPVDPGLKQGLNGELGFKSERFVPLQTEEDAEEETVYKVEEFPVKVLQPLPV